MSKFIDDVKKYYNENAEKEWTRLTTHAFEFEITKHMMDDQIKPGDTILDIGGGPGRYAIYYAEKGCKVTLVDLSESNIKIAEREAELANVKITTHVCDATNLELINLDQFDHVFLMGPLYHLVSTQARKKATLEALRHLKPGGYLYVSFIMLFAGMIYYMKHDPEGVLTDPSREIYINDVIKDKPYQGDAFTKAYFITPAKIKKFMKKFPLDEVMLFGQEGILAPQELLLLSATERAKSEWLRIAIELSTRKEYLSYSEHATYIGRKKF
ncbi:MAG: class I SAM-dependent methyltransferase [Acholeplasmataceae bacterium]|jgi:ubiquinone/menaquinone biosynthesis C-methylase UbiE|nr:class I SAM-dependent methyltransferase [Acholeplasmataceae bacterium]